MNFSAKELQAASIDPQQLEQQVPYAMMVGIVPQQPQVRFLIFHHLPRYIVYRWSSTIYIYMYIYIYLYIYLYIYISSKSRLGIADPNRQASAAESAVQHLAEQRDQLRGELQGRWVRCLAKRDQKSWNPIEIPCKPCKCGTNGGFPEDTIFFNRENDEIWEPIRESWPLGEQLHSAEAWRKSTPRPSHRS